MPQHFALASSVMAILSALVGFCYLTGGFNNRQLVHLLQSPYTCRQATYDLRRLKRKELIAKVPHTNRYQLTNLGRRVAVLFNKTYGRILAPGLSALDPHLLEEVVTPNPLSTSWRCFEESSRRLYAGAIGRRLNLTVL